MYQVTSPILFLIFNRPKETTVLFNAIKAVKPKKLYVAADGPRNNGKDDASCKETRAIINQVDWDCEVITLFREQNLGCGKAVSGAITWFFENEEEGIILEDDCLPSDDFFRFVDAMLIKYRVDDRIGHICGCNFQDGIKRSNADYYYSKLTHVWGWASWRRVWSGYDFKMNGLEEVIATDVLAGLTNSKLSKKMIYNAFRRTKAGEIDTWDYQYFFLNQVNARLSVIPNFNMISNIGFNADGTHTFNANSPMANVSFKEMPELIVSPSFISQDRIADEYTLTKETPSSFEFYKGSLRQGLRTILIGLKLYTPRK
ncbi:glycosyltransferase family protein [Flavobacterium algicola]|uniref:nucleotide-diphospho-sugar transferase n=1 Tax=Flavobacterium algicola TaxID=556529 RepID=UPI001EFD08BD|nr:nucleotide-diphospho-sugar transferase [Flavobacterium algicola]MCG9793931.1 nucleotide-diphospho-sugar transferase [Flavobacterium algicola]